MKINEEIMFNDKQNKLRSTSWNEKLENRNELSSQEKNRRIDFVTPDLLSSNHIFKPQLDQRRGVQGEANIYHLNKAKITLYLRASKLLLTKILYLNHLCLRISENNFNGWQFENFDNIAQHRPPFYSRKFFFDTKKNV